ncbi:hypothetical protein MJL30_39120, partial [Salmonella enterica subsp. enterica serovar Anatum]|nr:hypothetical protein [Salmonella enterica subsp. enterica serovar Anatum]
AQKETAAIFDLYSHLLSDARLRRELFAEVDKGAVAEWAVKKMEGFAHQEIRQYSLTRKPDGKGYRIAVKREDGGQVSNWLHHHA